MWGACFFVAGGWAVGFRACIGVAHLERAREEPAHLCPLQIRIHIISIFSLDSSSLEPVND